MPASGNPNPWHARHAKRKVRKPGNLQQLQAKLWRALCEAEAVLDTSEDPELTLKAVHAISQCAGQYAKLLEIGELEARVQALEQQMKGEQVA
jgi:hypothetical protein